MALGGAALFLAAAAPAQAQVLAPVPTIVPTQVFLPPGTHDGTLRLTNERDVPMRFELKSFGWEMSADGQIVLRPTDDVRVSPGELSLEPRATAEVRVEARTVPATRVEGTYRITITETPEAETLGAGLRVLAAVSLPVFLRPEGVSPDGQIEEGDINDGTLSFTIRNVGSAHLFVRELTVQGQDAQSAVVFESVRNGWYVLADGRRDYRVMLSGKDCQESRRVVIRVALMDGSVMERTVEPDGKRCGGVTTTEFL